MGLRAGAGAALENVVYTDAACRAVAAVRAAVVLGDRVAVVRPVIRAPLVLCYHAAPAVAGCLQSGGGSADRAHPAQLGLGAVGQMLVQLARMAGADWVGSADAAPLRRALALKHGAQQWTSGSFKRYV